LLLVGILFPHITRIIQSRRKETDGSCGPYGGEEKYIQSFDVGTCKKRRRGRYKHRWDNNIIRDIQGTEWGVMD